MLVAKPCMCIRAMFLVGKVSIFGGDGCDSVRISFICLLSESYVICPFSKYLRNCEYLLNHILLRYATVVDSMCFER